MGLSELVSWSIGGEGLPERDPWPIGGVNVGLSELDSWSMGGVLTGQGEAQHPPGFD